MKLEVGDIIRWRSAPHGELLVILRLETISYHRIPLVVLRTTKGDEIRYFLSTLESACIKVNHYKSKLGKVLYK